MTAQPTPQEGLTPRELDCVEAFRIEGTERAAAARLGISVHTLKVHLAHARSKRGVTRTWMLFEAA